MMDPNTVKYDSASHPRCVIAPKCRREDSPLRLPNTNKIIPPQRDCMADLSSGSRGCLTWRDAIEPAAQQSEPVINTPAPIRFTRPVDCQGATSSKIPPNPSNRPTEVREVGAVPPGRTHSRMTIHRETVVTNRAAMPEGTVCSAQVRK